MAATDDQEMVEALFAEGAHPTLRIGVRVRRPNRRPDHLEAFGTEHLVEPAAELRVAVVDQQPKRLLVAELHHQVARLLRRPAAVRVRRTGDVLDPPCRERDEEQHVDPPQEDGLDREKVAGQRGCRLLTQEGSPRQAGALRRGRHTRFDQHAPHRRRRDRDTDAFQLASDPPISPAWVLLREAKDQRHGGGFDRRPPRLRVGVGPTTSDEPAMPTQQRLRPHRKARPGRSRKRPTQRGQERAISPRQPRPTRLTPQHRHLVPQHQDLQLLRPTRPPQQEDEREQTARRQIRKRPQQTTLPHQTRRQSRA